MSNKGNRYSVAFISQKGIEPNARILPICNPAERIVVKKAGEVV